MSEPAQTRPIRHFDRPLRRLAWIVPASLFLWVLIFIGFAQMLGNHADMATVAPLQVSLTEFGAGMPGGSPGSGPGARGGDGGLMHKPSAAAVPGPPPVAPGVGHAARRAGHAAIRPRHKPAPAVVKGEEAATTLTRRENEMPSAPSRMDGAASEVKPAQAVRDSLASLGGAKTASTPGGAGSGDGTGAGGGGSTGSGSGGGGGGTGGGIGGGVQAYATVEHPPVPISRVMPSYPGEARSQGVEGEVVLRAIVDQNGAVEPDIVVVESVPLLDRPAIEALRQWRFEPGRDAANHAVRVVVEVPLRFRLR